ncbi:SIS domain-containing protein [Acuticoccus sp. MNP-M23]|uniref:SIS domain-containing protein n=1 Tax=Acuticoccus sp. MNP-M23 TaxID=3072793 RepID=UPI002816069A|nr:SIS domain-containing protein [Acuticoccus sp. MNP-M23]WMS45078.1 SIS domain-containing protein [Acuticoccus sp. MNP-M23]
MLAEAAEAGGAVASLLTREKATLGALARRFAFTSPPVVTTAARGSSDHAASFFKYLMELGSGIPVASIGPSVASVYGRPLQLAGALHITVSQSGESPDLIALQDAAKAGGAFTLAVVNASESPIALSADLVLDIGAGPERSVAATKSFIASAAALAASVAALTHDDGLDRALAALPAALDAAPGAPDEAVARLSGAAHIYCVGRGPALAIASEAALKFKEVAAIHAEPFSLAEVMHGPLALVGPAFPVVGFVPGDAGLENAQEALGRLSALGADLFCFSSGTLPGTSVPLPATGAPALDALAGILPFYRLVHAVARARGLDPEAPPHLAKVTRTA